MKKNVKSIILGGLIAVLFTQCKLSEKMTLNTRNEIVNKGLKSTKSIISKSNFPKSSDISIFLENSVIQSSLDGLIGTQIINTDEGYFNKWYCKIDTLKLQSNTGAYYSNIFLSIYSKDHKLKGEIQLENAIIISYADRDKKENQLNIRLDLLPLNYHLKAKLGLIEIGTRKKNRFLADMLLLIAKNKLHTTIPIKDKLEYNFQLAENTTEKIFYNEEDESQGFVKLKTTTESHKFIKYLQFEAPAFLPNGIWFNFKLSENPINVNSFVTDTVNNKPRELEKANQLLIIEINKLAANENIHPKNSKVWLNKNIISGTLDDFNKLPSSLKTIYINSVEENGHLVKEIWKSDISDGGYYAELTDDNTIRGSVEIKELQYKWIPEVGLGLNVDLKAKIKSDIHVHFDPYIGGGFGGQINLVGSAAQNIEGAIKIEKETLGNTEVLLIKPDIICNNIPITIESNNEEFGSIGKLATVGIRTEQIIGNKYITPSSLFSNIPLYIEVQDSKDTTSSNIKTPYKYLISQFSIIDFSIENEGILLEINDSIHFSNDANITKDIDEANTQLIENISNYYGNNEKKCPEASPLVGFIGPFELGPNNDVLIALAKLGADMSKLTGNAKKEWDKFLLTPGDAIVDMPENVVVASAKAIEDAKKEAERLAKKLADAKAKIDAEATRLKKEADAEATRLKKEADKKLTDLRKKLLGNKKVKIKWPKW